MILRLDYEDMFASISEGGPSCARLPLTSFHLETLLETADYSIRGLDIADVQIDNSEPFQSPVIFLYNKKTDESAACIRTETEQGIIMYDLYKYSSEKAG